MKRDLFFIIGTKGQLIKTAPILIEMDKHNMPYYFINAMQHSITLKKQINSFNLKRPLISLKGYKHDITNKKEIFLWLVYNTIDVLRKIKKYSKHNERIVVVHGDAPPVLLGIVTKLLPKTILIHLEAGERTNNLFQPFPEEIIRRLADRFSDIKFASSTQSFKNLEEEGLIKNTINIKENTLIDAVKMFSNEKFYDSFEPYVLCSIHRYETITNYEKLSFIIKTLERLSNKIKIIFPLHQSTKWQLEKFDLLTHLYGNKNIKIRELEDYPKFVMLIKNAEFIITDGGGPQQESAFLGTPCLLMRNVTEREEYKNVCLAKFSDDIVNYFIQNYKKYRIPLYKLNFSPSKIVFKTLYQLVL